MTMTVDEDDPIRVEPMTPEDLAADRAICDAATSGPWRDLTAEWNAAQEAYYERNGKHYYGHARGWRKRSAKETYALIVRDNYHGEPIDLNPGKFGPDWWDLDKIIAMPLDVAKAYWKGDVIMTASIEWPDDPCPDRAFIAAARTRWPAALDRIEQLEAENARLRAMTENPPEPTGAPA